MIPEDLAKSKYANIYTYRKDGSVVKTTVLIGKDGDRILIHTGEESGKVKRIRRNPKVMIEPSTILGKSRGKTYSGTAKILTGEEREEGLKKVTRCCLEKFFSYLFHDVISRKSSAIIEIKLSQ
ncbi:MAG: PPOX class F420-dependent oxidoreductase [Nitrososphaeria archaeon]|nr:PPOX class F420-dependent oxidoreductase [Conexivisphaerales archaeon]